MIKLMYRAFNAGGNHDGHQPIKTDADYRAALKQIETLMMSELDTPEGEKLDVLVTLVEAYEQKQPGL